MEPMRGSEGESAGGGGERNVNVGVEKGEVREEVVGGGSER